jgi:hypothetical protein
MPRRQLLRHEEEQSKPPEVVVQEEPSVGTRGSDVWQSSSPRRFPRRDVDPERAILAAPGRRTMHKRLPVTCIRFAHIRIDRALATALTSDTAFGIILLGRTA